MAAKAWTATEARREARADGSMSDESRRRIRKLAAEAIGTFLLVLGGVGTAVLAGDFMGTLGVALAFGLTLVVLMYVIGPVSGCHVNPAVTIGLCAAKKIAPKDAAAYIVAQCVGAIVAAAAIYLIADAGPFGYSARMQGLGANGYGAHSPAGFGLGGAFLAEVLLTGLLVFTCLGATHIQAPVGFAGIAIGFVLAVCNLVSIPIDNTGVNPARSLGPAVFAGGWALSQLWLFIVAPIVGALVAAAVHRVLRPEPGVRLSTAARALPSESEARIAQETARLLKMPVGAPRHLADGRRAPAGAEDSAKVGAGSAAGRAGRDPDRFRDRDWNRDQDRPGDDTGGC
ncbi:aquaporin Z [Frankia sp. AgB1.9]|nr:aquaporin Z [Frankia sp. AgW1.1]MBL7547021.1 aquaporin Z [Frankia sp. AgB1.9]MBL7617650.1 aquaporin Z [Frankia sp. AgB1.8]